MNNPSAQFKKVIFKIAIILILLLVSLFPAKYINSVYGYLPFWGLLSLLLLSVLYLVIIRNSIHFKAEDSDAVCQRGEKVNVILKIVNGSFLICPKARANLYVSDFFGGDDYVLPAVFTMRAQSESEFSLAIKMNHVGMYSAGVKTLQIYDMLGIFSTTIPGSREFSVTVLPKTLLSDEIEFKDKMLSESHNARNSTVSDGFDYTGVREYALGDSIKRIHWKLSAHSNNYMTKITETSNKNDLAVVIDLLTSGIEHDVLPGIYDCIVETGVSLIKQAMNRDIEYSMLFVGKNREIARVIPKGRQDYENLVRMLPAFYTDSDADVPDGADILENESRLGNRSANIILCTAKITDHLVHELINIKQQKRNPMLYYIIKPDVNSHEVEDLKAPLQALDDYNIIYHTVIAEAVS
ncbi:MAG: DUF58 domain-containing protein [Syntrophomonas sp.]